MSFDQREWVNDIVTGTFTGVMGGLVAAIFVPDPPFQDLTVAGGFTGLVTGISVLPLKWLLNHRPGTTDPSTTAPRDSSESDEGSSSGDAAPKTEDSSS